ncbi:MAG TPA: hypothetical protein VIV11_11085 [Kofleriaceae bacterium]
MRMRSLVLVVAALLVAGCKKDKAAPPSPSPKQPLSTAEQDTLWKLAPAGTLGGFVISSKGLASVEGGWLAIRKLFQSAPELMPIAAKLDAELTKELGTPNLTLAELGLAPGKGGAFFVVSEDDVVVIVPIGDRAKFVKVAKGTQNQDGTDTFKDGLTCKMVQSFYACAKPVALLDQIGKSDGKALTDRLAMAGGRGDLEGVADKIDTKLGTPIQFAVVGQLERGGAVFRGAVKGLPPMVTSKLVASGNQKLDPTKLAGFAVMNVAPLLAGVPIPPETVVPGVTLTDLTSNINGAVTITIPPGALMFDVRVPMKDTAPAQKVIDQCPTIPPLAMLGAKVDKGVCHVAVPQMMLELDAWTEGKELRVGKKGGTQAASVTPTAAATELAQGEWAFSLYGRGTLLGEGQFPPIPIGAMPEEAKYALRAMMFLNEVGLGVRVDGDTVRFVAAARTAWSNPDDVVAKLVAIEPAAIMQGQAAASAKQIASASPSSPFAQDFKAGLGGLMIPAAAVGMLAAVAIPAFMDYQKKAKRPEALLHLNRLAKNLKVAHISDDAFPKGKVALTPAKPCCENQGKCNDPAAWQHPIWQALDFSIDEPHFYRYSYESDGKTFTVKAVGDLDCDGTAVEYVMQGTTDAQGVTTKLVEPAPNTD